MELTRLNPGYHYLYDQDIEGHFMRCGFTVPFAAKFLTLAMPALIHNMAHLKQTKIYWAAQPHGCPGLR